ncbi:MAG: signal peptidase I [Nitrospiraceae bacterium]|nr:signal peptidase I [Nitrospiraceae bacterium]
MTKQKIWENIKIILTAALLALFIRAFVVQAFKIPSGSMIPTLLVGDHLLVNKFIYGLEIPFTNKKILALKSPQRGDIVVFRFPEDPSRDFIKRVIGVEGDIVEMREKVVYVNEKPLIEPYAKYLSGPGVHSKEFFGPYLVPKGKFFVMGDNRDQSYDSRFWGYVDMKDLRGKALVIYWSWDSSKNFPRFNRIGDIVR